MTKYMAECILDRRIEKQKALNCVINDIIVGDKKEIEETGISFLQNVFNVYNSIQIDDFGDFVELVVLIGAEVVSDNERHQEYIRHSFYYKGYEVMCLEDKSCT